MMKSEKIIMVQKYVLAVVVVAALITLGVFVPSAFAADGPTMPSQISTGNTSLVLQLQRSGEYGGTGSTGETANPDKDGDGFGDNLAFTVPTRVDFMVTPLGELIGPHPDAMYIENESAYSVHVSSLRVSAKNDWNIVQDAKSSSAENSIDITLGPSGDKLNAASYLTKSNVVHPAEWNMGPRTSTGTSDRVTVVFSGHVNNIIKDISKETAFGTIEWYLTPGIATEE